MAFLINKYQYVIDVYLLDYNANNIYLHIL
jgi:hypothetical protein